MLRKLMKHELRATGRVMLPMLGLTLLTAVGGNVAVYNMVDGESAVLGMLGVVLLISFVLALAGSYILSFALMIRRFYQNLLRDEGYLMMTLPVSVHAHVLSKLFVSLIWAAVTLVTTGVAMCILVFELEFVDVILYDLGELLAQLEFSGLKLVNIGGHAVLLIIEIALLLAVADSCLCLQIYASMAVGHSFTHHKGILSVAAYFLLSLGWSVLQNGAMGLLSMIAPDGVNLGMQNLTQYAQAHLNLLTLTAAMLIPTAIWYGITTYFLKNRLNLG